MEKSDENKKSDENIKSRSKLYTFCYFIFAVLLVFIIGAIVSIICWNVKLPGFLRRKDISSEWTIGDNTVLLNVSNELNEEE